jgi:hypothetical protein
VQRPNLGVLSPGPSNPGPSKLRLPTEPGAEAVTIPSPNLESPKELDDEVAQGSPPSPELADPELHLDHQSLSMDSQLADLQAAKYAAKAKAKESRHILGTTRVGIIHLLTSHPSYHSSFGS